MVHVLWCTYVCISATDIPWGKIIGSYEVLNFTSNVFTQLQGVVDNSVYVLKFYYNL